MTIEEIKSKSADYNELVSAVKATKTTVSVIEQALNQYNVDKHEVFDPTKRPDKTYKDENGADTISYVTRLGVSFQKQIVDRASTFLCGNPVELISNPADEKEKSLLAAVTKVWEDNKLDYKSKGIAEKMMSETEVAELWYVEEVKPEEKYWQGIISDNAKFKLRMKILANSLGDTLYPIYSPTGDMIAFSRAYTVTLEGNKKEEHFDTYTAETIYLGTKSGSTWNVTPSVNPYKKIPIIYYSQPKPEWADVQSLIDRFEKQLSNLSDTNDYFGSPMITVTGKIVGFAKKGETGKVLEMEEKAKAEYLTWNQAPASVEMEMKALEKLIYTLTDTPNISFDEMKSLGVFSGIALKMLFLAAHMKASKKEEPFGESIQRRINYIKAAIGVIDISFANLPLTIKPKFEYFLPKDVMEKIDILVNAVQGKILSLESAVKQNPLVENAVIELEKIKAEGDSGSSLNDQFN